jgi:hypothetical protein
MSGAGTGGLYSPPSVIREAPPKDERASRRKPVGIYVPPPPIVPLDTPRRIKLEDKDGRDPGPRA